MFGKNFHKKPTEKQIIGKIGEDFACTYLENQGFSIIDRNYSRKWGELDIVARKGNVLHFIEVKCVSRPIRSENTLRALGAASNRVNETDRAGVTCETPVVEQSSLRGEHDAYRPEDNMHPWKLKRLGRAIQSYLLDKNVSDDIDWQFDVATVYVDKNGGVLETLVIEDIVL